MEIQNKQVNMTWKRNNMKNYRECECGIDKSVPMITIWHQEACPVVTNGDRRGRIFLSQWILILAHHYISHFLEKGSQKFLNRLRYNITRWRHFNLVMTSHVFWRATVRFLFFPTCWYIVCAIEFFLTWVNTAQTPNWCARITYHNQYMRLTARGARA